MSCDEHPHPAVPEDEMWIQPDPNQDPSDLRFAPGNLVMFLLEGSGWIEGEVLKVSMRLQIPPEIAGHANSTTPPIKYVVWPHSYVPDNQYGSQWIHYDTDDFIRPRQELHTWSLDDFNPRLVPPKYDPLAYLYTGVSFDPYDEDGNEIAQSFNDHDFVDSAKTNPDGSVRIKITDGEEVNSFMVEFPKEPIFGVPGHAIVQIGSAFQRRSSYNNPQVRNPIETFKAWVPHERSLAQLEAASRGSSKKMLEFGDALMSGVHGWPRDPMRACRCYLAAAWGCQEHEESTRIGVPVGEPEAMVECANVRLIVIKKEFLHLDLWDSVGTRLLVSAALQSERGIGILHQIMFWLATAARGGHVAPLTLDFASAANDMELLQDRRIRDDPDLRDALEILLTVLQYRNLEIKFQELQEKGVVPRGDPSNEVMDMFGEKANKIFIDMPTSSDLVHLEYRQIPRHPFPYVVFAIVPSRKETIKVVTLPDCLQMCPFSEESFAYAWHRIAFALHLGNPVTSERERPAVFTVLDSHGNRQFSQFLKNAIRGSSTEVRLVSYMEPIRSEGSNRSRQRESQLGSIIHDLESRLLEIPNYLVSERPANGSTSETESSEYRMANEIFIESDIDQAKASANQLKNQGNQLFGSSDFAGATKCYSIVIELVRLLSDSTDEINLLLGTTLSNRAACFLEMESQRMSVAFQKLLVQNAIRDCTSALESSWASRVLPRRIVDKLKFRRDKAQARLDVLQSDFQSEIASIIFPSSGPSRQEADGARTEETNETSSPLDSSPTQEDSQSTKPIEDLLLESGQVIYKNHLATNSKDGCPICLRQFDGELSSVFSAVLPCHQHAVCTECICGMKKRSDKERTDIACPLCRFRFEGRIAERLSCQIIEKDDVLSGLVEKFPAEGEVSFEVAKNLLWKSDFRIDRVVNSLEGILDDRVSGAFFRTESDLDHKQKKTIYEQARRPVIRLQDKINTLIEEQQGTFETSKLKEISEKLRALRSEIATARLKARDEIYERLNSIGNMGAQNVEEDNTILVDFHGLHVNEMHSKYKELVEAILPVVKKVTVITGRGLHSTGGASKLMIALKKKIEKDKNTRWDSVPRNPGALVVHWVAE
mmetsp:Transcript_35059/g.84824  ORF Transcript_35059/g.84824 Transcript_35059/m.84824 type:complete len:1109 (-) Transcript_35059:1667-4993(-)|eukprot:CAMPEP_0113463956 /NCGR_PEP_ID=MMETSP0014_2-20120614/12940_1 /TAXON_ID=2857 /ORGANISM="Nitzschia sp." /LENGTH=1108 /DNA_ID=CAMNT_0000355997 /DNA_START=127 /DNA_END=3453 /DNA_ORIENTATION=+ /assembly_acc=CAM_ASM_000159